MILTYKQKATKLNNAAKYFAALGYHVSTSFLSQCGEMEVTVYFHQHDQKQSLESILRTYKDEGDIIEYDELSRNSGDKFYTLTLKKYPS